MIECRVVCSEKTVSEYGTRYKFRGVMARKWVDNPPDVGGRQMVEDTEHPNWAFWKASPSITFEINIDQAETSAEYEPKHQYRVLMEDMGPAEPGV